ncbi:DUF1642 domain-containing protein [Lacticaseibacillus rhamnosus]|uniref:DUF1642 domain-containing protein n=1 Tax=Lacticaseibacillus rhamnosus TaxID=47715 RepID=UPI00237F181A|nr:DUF1642 domain-containing protein [Lacticaseibacillus rhamnosus]MDE3301572.1 DUF1642 domain-containing protein [Lacticaseibacillus rhamnosus]
MSEEKLYAVKNDEGKYWDFLANSGFWSSEIADPTTTIRKKQAELVADEHGGHVVTLVEEPKKVVLTKEQAEIVERAHDYIWPAKYITDNCGNSNGLEELLMNAYVNGYTVAKEKKYNVKVPHTKDVWYVKINDAEVLTISPVDKTSYGKFTEAEIEHYGLQDCEKEEVTDDGD